MGNKRRPVFIAADRAKENAALGKVKRSDNVRRKTLRMFIQVLFIIIFCSK